MLTQESNPTVAEIGHYAMLASGVLSQEIKYKRDKDMITRVFEWSRNYDNKVLLRLAVIDGFYSTQLNRRLHGLEDLARAFRSAGADNESLFTQTALGFLDALSTDSPILSLIQQDEIGEQKNGERGGKAASLITKYLFYATSRKFPIYDDLVRDSYTALRTKFKNLPKMGKECGSQFFQAIDYLNRASTICDYDGLDNLLWLLGKINKGSLSATIDDTNYEAILDMVQNRDELKSWQIDKSVADILAAPANQKRLAEILGIDFMRLVSYRFHSLQRTKVRMQRQQVE